MKRTRILFNALLVVAISTLIIWGCKQQNIQPKVTSNAKGGSQSSNIFLPLTLACSPVGPVGENEPTQTSIALTVTAGATGAPAGFSIQWMTYDAFHANGDVWPTDSSLWCSASFSGVPWGASSVKQAGLNSYSLGANQPVTIVIGDLASDLLNQQLGFSTTACNDGLLQCGTRYVFRAFAHGNSTTNRSAYTIYQDACATTADCGTCGHHGFGYWKQHPELITDLTIGGTFYSASDVFTILNEPPTGNGLVELAHQLIAAELNGICILPTTDGVFAGHIIPLAPITPKPKTDGVSFIQPSEVAGLVGTLHAHNNGCIIDGCQ